jgi:hypothetical protein
LHFSSSSAHNCLLLMQIRNKKRRLSTRRLRLLPTTL